MLRAEGVRGGYIMYKCESKCSNNNVKYTRFYEKLPLQITTADHNKLGSHGLPHFFLIFLLDGLKEDCMSNFSFLVSLSGSFIIGLTLFFGGGGGGGAHWALT